MGNNKVYSLRYPLCNCNWCNNKVSAITKNNFKFSVTYCEKHCKVIKTNCRVCGKELTCRASDVIDIMNEG